MKAYDENGNEINYKEKGLKSEFRDMEIAQKFVDFYKDFHPKYRFEITETRDLN